MSSNVVHISSAPESSDLPSLSAAIQDAETTESILRTLRHFHLGNPDAASALKAVGNNLLPALLAPFRDTSRLRYDYPLFLMPPALAESTTEASELTKPLGQLLSDCVDSMSSRPDDATILKDNIGWIERDIRDRIRDIDGPVDALSNIKTSSDALIKHLKLEKQNQQKLAEDIESLLSTIPAGGQLLSYGRYPAIHLLMHVVACKVEPRHKRFLKEIDSHINDLKSLLDVDWNKSEESRKPEQLKQSIGATDRIDTAVLSKVMKHSQGSLVMSPQRKQRIEKTLEVLEKYRHQKTIVQFIHNGSLDEPWLNSRKDIETLVSDDPCDRAMRLFDESASRLADVFKSVRTADLETQNIYDAAVHDPWFENFSWEAFSQDELLLVPTVIAFESADHAATSGMSSFSRLLNSGRPVQVFVRVQAHNNPGASSEEDPFNSYRTELGYLGISHRQAVVSQASAARHQHLIQRYTSALDATRTSLHLINIGLRPTGQDNGLNAWLVAGAALEGRVHPFFFVNPSAGDSGVDKFDFSGNPQPERDWPIHPYSYHDSDGNRIDTELAFTFADYALLIERLYNHFAIIPAECISSDLIPVAEFIKLPESETYHRIPYIWAVDENNVLHRLAVTRAMIHACKDRLNFWHSLQEFAGVKNAFIDKAVAETRTELEAKATIEREQLLAAHQAEIARVKSESAAEVMGRLTDILLEMDLSSPLPMATMKMPPKAQSQAETKPEAANTVETDAETDTDEDEIIEEAWIDSALCTSCNDCLAINPVLFVYNENNQAYLSDLSTGTYAHLVEAAEICPSKCIHPGLPIDKSEKDLDELIARAAPFN